MMIKMSWQSLLEHSHELRGGQALVTAHEHEPILGMIETINLPQSGDFLYLELSRLETYSSDEDTWTYVQDNVLFLCIQLTNAMLAYRNSDGSFLLAIAPVTWMEVCQLPFTLLVPCRNDVEVRSKLRAVA